MALIKGWLHRWRRGLLGVIKSWARGSRKHVVMMIATLIGADHGFGIEDEIRERFAGEQLKKAATDAYIVDRAVAALDTLKLCGTEQARQEYHIVLGALAPEVVRCWLWLNAAREAWADASRLGCACGVGGGRHGFKNQKVSLANTFSMKVLCTLQIAH